MILRDGSGTWRQEGKTSEGISENEGRVRFLIIKARVQAGVEMTISILSGESLHFWAPWRKTCWKAL